MTKEEAIAFGKRVIDLGFKGETQAFCELAIKALEQEPCEDAISREAMLLLQVEYAEDMSATKFWRMRDDIRSLPPVTSKEKTGHWIENAPEYQNIDPPYICSECGNMHLRKTNYCDQCGAKMIEAQESEDKECTK